MSTDPTISLGVLMEAAERQQSAVASAVQSLQQAVGGMEGVVRDQVRNCLVSGLGDVIVEAQALVAAMRAMKRALGVRFVLLAAASAIGVSVLLAFSINSRFPSVSELSALQQRREQLQQGVRLLESQGGAARIGHCGARQKPCVQVLRSGPVYGPDGDFMLLKEGP